MPNTVDTGGRYSAAVGSPGAGRMVDFMWPDPLMTISTAAAVTQGRNRLLNTAIAVATGGFGGGGATLGLSQAGSFGSCVVTIGAGAADGVGQLARFNTGTAPGIFQQTARQGTASSDYGDMSAARVYANYALSAFGGGSAVADCGLEITDGGGLIQSQSSRGMGFGRSAQGVITARIQTVGGGASSILAVTGPGTGLTGYNEALIHSYDVQFVSATANSDAFIQWLIDGKVVRKVSYGAGTNLPSLQTGTATCWTALLVNVAALVNALSVPVNAGLRVIQAPTLDACY